VRFGVLSLINLFLITVKIRLRHGSIYLFGNARLLDTRLRLANVDHSQVILRPQTGASPPPNKNTRPVSYPGTAAARVFPCLVRRRSVSEGLQPTRPCLPNTSLDLISTLTEAGGDVSLAATRITEGQLPTFVSLYLIHLHLS
jgi:hypothetical protein